MRIIPLWTNDCCLSRTTLLPRSWNRPNHSPRVRHDSRHNKAMIDSSYPLRGEPQTRRLLLQGTGENGPTGSLEAKLLIGDPIGDDDFFGERTGFDMIMISCFSIEHMRRGTIHTTSIKSRIRKGIHIGRLETVHVHVGGEEWSIEIIFTRNKILGHDILIFFFDLPSGRRGRVHALPWCSFFLCFLYDNSLSIIIIIHNEPYRSFPPLSLRRK